jgi:signal transduction histidine kinase
MINYLEAHPWTRTPRRTVIKGKAQPLPPTLELSAYRVIQEALTNTRRRSQATTASVRLQYGMTELQIEVVDGGPLRESAPATRQVGHGLIGMRERAALHRGQLRAGPRPGADSWCRRHLPLNRGAV